MQKSFRGEYKHMKTTESYRIHAGHFFRNGVFDGETTVVVENGMITSIETGFTGKADYTYPWLSPALIDNHIHGGDGVSVYGSTPEQIEAWLVKLAEAGVGGVVLAPSGQPERIRQALGNLKQVMDDQKTGRAGGARVIGAHLEGPFISAEKPGAMEAVIPPSVETFRQMTDGYEDIVKEVTLAPENPGAAEVIEYLCAGGIRILSGHTNATYAEAVAAFASGVGAQCHTFNAARSIHHREPGVVTAALTNPDVYCEMIADLEHLHPGTLHLIRHCKGRERILLISDGVMTTHLPDGIYGRVEVKNGVNRVVGLGCLSGGGCYTAQSVGNLVKIGFDFADAIMAGAVNPARWMGLPTEAAVGDPVFLTGWNEDCTPAGNHIGGNTYVCGK